MGGKDIKRIRDALRQIQRESGWAQKNDVQCCGVTMAQCHALVEIGSRIQVSIVELAGVLGVDSSTLSRTIDNLVKGGLVDRILNPRDRRYVTVSLTGRGRSVFSTLEDTFEAYIGRLLDHIPDGKRPQVVESLALIASAMERCNDRFPCCSEASRNEGGK